MKDTKLFAAALALKPPWYIKKIDFRDTAQGEKELHIEVDHQKRVKFEYEGELCPVHDHQLRSWRHLRFFQHDCYLHARVPRVKTESGEVRLVAVPWAEPGSSFTLLFELDVLKLMDKGMSASAVGRHYSFDSRIASRIVGRHVSNALATQELRTVKDLSVDETSRKKGHNYLTILCDRQAKKVVGVSLGKDQKAVGQALIDMEARGADRATVRSVTLDMSRSYIAACESYLPQAEMVFDRFHLVKKLNEAIDTIRRAEQKQFKEALKHSRYLWLRNASKLSQKQQQRLDLLKEAFPNLGQAYRLKELFREVFDAAQFIKRLKPLNEWIKMAWDSGIKPIQEFVNMLHDHWYGIKTYFKRLANNAFAEGVNLKIQEIKRIARGYRNPHNFILMIYFKLGGLDLKIH
jgi:transposase